MNPVNNILFSDDSDDVPADQQAHLTDNGNTDILNKSMFIRIKFSFIKHILILMLTT